MDCRIWYVLYRRHNCQCNKREPKVSDRPTHEAR